MRHFSFSGFFVAADFREETPRCGLKTTSLLPFNATKTKTNTTNELKQTKQQRQFSAKLVAPTAKGSQRVLHPAVRSL